MIKYRATVKDDINKLIENIRLCDEGEIIATTELSIIDAIKRSCESSTMLSSAFINSKLLCIFGVVEQGDFGIPWLIGTKLMDSNKIGVVKASMLLFNEMIDFKSKLYNYVKSDNHNAISLLKFVGFEICESRPMFHSNEYFTLFKRGF